MGHVISVFLLTEQREGVCPPLYQRKYFRVIKCRTKISTRYFCSCNPNSEFRRYIAQNAVKRLKTLRHTNILRILDSCETDAGLYVVTEPCESLLDFVAREDRGFPAWGLYQVRQCAFLVFFG